MSCRTCSYIQKEFARKAGSRFYGFEYAIIESCWCDKVGGQISVFGRCTEDMEEKHTGTGQSIRGKAQEVLRL